MENQYYINIANKNTDDIRHGVSELNKAIKELSYDLDITIRQNNLFLNIINKAIKFINTQYNTYPSAEEWRKALLQILEGKETD